jgi:hypothetical protein
MMCGWSQSLKPKNFCLAEIQRHTVEVYSEGAMYE